MLQYTLYLYLQVLKMQGSTSMICITKYDKELYLTVCQFISLVHLNIIIKQSTVIIAPALPILINFPPQQFLFHCNHLQGVACIAQCLSHSIAQCLCHCIAVHFRTKNSSKLSSECVSATFCNTLWNVEGSRAIENRIAWRGRPFCCSREVYVQLTCLKYLKCAGTKLTLL